MFFFFPSFLPISNFLQREAKQANELAARGSRLAAQSAILRSISANVSKSHTVIKLQMNSDKMSAGKARDSKSTRVDGE